MRHRFPPLLPSRFHHRHPYNSHITTSSRHLPPPPLPSRLQNLACQNSSHADDGSLSPSPSPFPVEPPSSHFKNVHFNPTQIPKPSEILPHPVPSTHVRNPSVNFYPATYNDIVHRCISFYYPCDAEELHRLLIKSGYNGDRFLMNCLINLYVKRGNLEVAYKIFDEVIDKNTVSWTCLISGYAQQGQPEEACSLFRSMVSSGIAPTQFAFGSVLQACHDCGLDFVNIGPHIHAIIWKSGYVFDSVVCNALISMYGCCSSDSMSDVLRVFNSAPKANVISWNSIISVCSRRGYVVTAFELFSEMQKTGINSCFKPNEYTFSSLITLTYCQSSSHSTDIFGLQLLSQLLSRLTKAGFLGDLYVGSALVSAFARFSLLDKAKDIYSQMAGRNFVTMNGLMVGLVKQNQGELAVEVFRETIRSTLVNIDSYIVLLGACSEFSFLEEGKRKGREVHSFIVRRYLNSYSVAVSNGLVNMYAKCGAIEKACKIFERMCSKDQVSWNSIISGLDQNGHFKETLLIFCRMQGSGMPPSNFAVISALSASASLRHLRMGAQVQTSVIKVGLDSDISVSNSLLALYGACDQISECWKVFYKMPDYDLISWNTMIGALADSAPSIHESISTLLDMMRYGFSPNRVTFINVLTALSSLSSPEIVSQIHTLVLKYGLSNDSAVENALLSCYASCGEMDSSERIFFGMSDRRDDVSWNSMVAAYIKNDLFSKAVDLVWLMKCSGQMIDCFTISIVLSACASIAALGRGMEMHAFGLRNLLDSDVVVESALVDMYSKCGRVDLALFVFRSMPFKNEFSWNSMISGYARHGHAEKALELFNEMQHEEQQPDHVTFVGILSACSHAGYVKEGLMHFESMTSKFGLVPKMEHYSCVVDLLGRAARLNQLEDFVRKMPMRPNVLVWRTVLVACSRAKDGGGTILGKEAEKMLMKLEPENPVNYVLLSHMYAARGRWEDVAKARTAMRGKTSRKEAGCSWVTLKDGLHIFVAGDKSHPQTREIYVKLQELNQRIRDAGYVPQTNFALYDLEIENKEELLSYHSEKLAIAFVLTRPSGLPIRIMKNLRVCGDCHLAFRYMSKVVGRQIILRDSNRFHHFDDGKCSCGDYW